MAVERVVTGAGGAVVCVVPCAGAGVVGVTCAGVDDAGVLAGGGGTYVDFVLTGGGGTYVDPVLTGGGGTYVDPVLTGGGGSTYVWVVTGVLVSDSVTGQTVVDTAMVSVVTWGPAGQLVTVGWHEVTVYDVVV